MNASSFRGLHHRSAPVVVPSVWDIAGAVVVARVGALAISVGRPCDSDLPRAPIVVRELTELVQRVIAAVDLPLSVDIEDGFAASPTTVAQHVRALIDLGVAGITLCDDNEDATLMAAKISRIKSAACSAGLDLFVDARTDVFLCHAADDEARVCEVIRRAAIYEDAGADGLFVPGLGELYELRTIIEAIRLPLDVVFCRGLLPGATALPPSALGCLGVKRLTTGAGVEQLLMRRLEALAN